MGRYSTPEPGQGTQRKSRQHGGHTRLAVWHRQRCPEIRGVGRGPIPECRGLLIYDHASHIEIDGLFIIWPPYVGGVNKCRRAPRREVCHDSVVRLRPCYGAIREKCVRSHKTDADVLMACVSCTSAFRPDGRWNAHRVRLQWDRITAAAIAPATQTMVRASFL